MEQNWDKFNLDEIKQAARVSLEGAGDRIKEKYLQLEQLAEQNTEESKTENA